LTTSPKLERLAAKQPNAAARMSASGHPEETEIEQEAFPSPGLANASSRQRRAAAKAAG